MTDALAAVIRTSVAEDLSTPELIGLGADDRREYARQRIFLHLDEVVGSRLSEGAEPPTVEEEHEVARTVLDSLFGMGRIQALVDDPLVENIDINGCDQVWVTYADGVKRSVAPVATTDEELVELVRSAAVRFGLSERRFDLAQPELDLRLPDGSRLSALMAVTARPALSIRRHRYTDLSLDDLVDLGTLDEEMSSFLAAAVRAQKNIVVAGAMNSGKTTLLRALASEIPRRERIVTIEQAFELGLDTGSDRHPDMVAIEARQANLEGEGRISVADMVRRALRMNADRVIVGEVLGDEVLPMLNAMSQGRSGSMCTIHADSSAGVFRRIASYAVQAPERLPLEASNLLIAGAIDFVVFLDSKAPDHEERGSGLPDSVADGIGEPEEGLLFEATAPRQRFISSIREVVDAEGVQVISNEVYRPDGSRRAVPGAPLRPETARDLAEHGYMPFGGVRERGVRIRRTGPSGEMSW